MISKSRNAGFKKAGAIALKVMYSVGNVLTVQWDNLDSSNRTFSYSMPSQPPQPNA